MSSIEIPREIVMRLVRGALNVDASPAGIRVTRLPDWALAQGEIFSMGIYQLDRLATFTRKSGSSRSERSCS
jgi:hypothetical protein